jgi:hypothetical protein
VSQAILRIEALPADALGAAGQFHREWSARAMDILGGECTALAIVLPAARYDHRDWRLAAARDLARAASPRRVNVVAGDDKYAVTAALTYLADAPGVTGQYLELDGHGAGNPAR